MTHQILTRSLSLALCTVAASAQGPDFLLSFSQTETTLSGSAGTVLRNLYPNEVAELSFTNSTCSTLSAEKWGARTCYHVMAGDENADTLYWNPAIFGRIDALLEGLPNTPVAAGGNQRTVFWSPSTSMGTNVSGPPGLRPGDVGRIVRNGVGDGQVEYFMSREQFNQALGLPLNTPIDVDAIAWRPGMGVYFSLDQDVLAFLQCGPALVEDGAIVCVPESELTYTVDFRISTVNPNSAFLLFPEAQMDLVVQAAQVTDRFGVCVSAIGDLESLEIDPSVPAAAVPGCAGTVIFVPTFLFSGETTTGASVLTTAGGGQIHVGPCGPMGTSCGNGPTFGPATGIQPTSVTVGAPSHVDALAFSRVCRYVLEPHQHVMNVPNGAPQGANTIDLASPFFWNFVFVEIVPLPVAPSLPAFPFSLLCFPDYYFWPTFTFWWPTPAPGGFGSFPMPAIPSGFTGKVLFQSIAFGGSGIEISAPCVVDV